jgi:hypothetical protein
MPDQLSIEDITFDALSDPGPATPTGVQGRKCRHPKDVRQPVMSTLGRTWRCGHCDYSPDPAKVRQGKNNRKRGNRKQRDVMLDHGFANVGGAGGAEDGLDDTFAVQHKAYQPKRYPGWALQELDHLRAKASDNLAAMSEGRVPLLIVSESPGQGKKARPPIAIMTLDELLALVRGRV